MDTREESEASQAHLDGDYAKAFRLFKPMADRGHTDAQFFIGSMYDFGDGVEQDDIKAIDWYRKAADQGHEDALEYALDMIVNSRGLAVTGDSENRLDHARALEISKWVNKLHSKRVSKK